jgi:hypothetical protein
MSENSLAPVVISAIAGVSAWVGTNFFAEPLLQFYKRRRSVRESLLYVANLDREIKGYDEAYNELRRHAAALDALDETAPYLVKLYLKARGYDLAGAAIGLIGFANSIGSHDGSRGVFRGRVRKALKFMGGSIS